MLSCAIKFCGGCNPRYDRPAAYRRICEETAGCAAFSLPQPGTTYDVLLVLQGCTGCDFTAEPIEAKQRLYCFHADDIERAIQTIRTLASHIS